MNPATSRKIKLAARHVVAARWIDGSEARPGLGVALANLGLGDAADALADGGVERLAAQVRVRHGERALLAFQLHVGLQILVASAARGATDRQVIFKMVESVAGASISLGLIGTDEALDAVYDQLRDDPLCSAVSDRVADLDAAVDGALGIVDGLRHGAVRDLDTSYAEAYRSARLLGVLRAEDLLTRDDDERLASELPFALQSIGFQGEIPVAPVSQEQSKAIWEHVEATLGIAVGGLAEQVHRAAFHLAVCGSLAFRGLALRKALGGLAVAVRSLGNDALSDQLTATWKAGVGVDLSTEADPIDLDVLDRVEEWLDAVLPKVGLDTVLAGAIAVHEDRFSGFDVPVNTARLEAFITQFRADHRWVAVGLLDAIDYRDRGQISRSVAFLLDGLGIQRTEGAVLCGLDATHEGGFMGPELTLPHRLLNSVLRDRLETTLVVIDDALLDPEPIITEISALAPKARKRLREVNLIFAFSMATQYGEARLREFFDDAGILHQILVGQRIAHLSAAGWEERPDVLTETELLDPLFSPHNRHWRDRDWSEARALCVEIGSALGDPKDALGRLGHQGRLVFGHRVPSSTLPLFWKGGTWRGSPWIPLFSVPSR